MEKLERNIQLYGVMKIFTKRVFLPLTAIYLVEIGKLSIAQIGILAVISAVVSLIAEIPTGFLADKLTRKSSLMIAGVMAGIGSLFYAFMPQFKGAVLATVFESLGYAFLSGAGEAMIHDTLVVLKRTSEYPRIVGRAQSFGLTGNVLLVSLVSLTYRLNKHLPFILGSIAYLCLIAIAYNLIEPPRTKPGKLHNNPAIDLFINLRLFVTKQTLLLFLAIGVIGGLYNAPSDFTNLITKDLGLQPHLLGFVFSAASVVGVVGGYFIHRLRSLSLRTYTLLDTAIICTFFMVIGLSHSLFLTIGAIIVSLGWWRLRAIMYQHYLLTLFGKSSYKATLISTAAFFIRGNEAWLPFLFVWLIGLGGYYHAYIYVGLASAVMLIPMFIFASRQIQPIMDSHTQEI